MGFGHRIYKNFDPRSRIMKKMCGNVLESLGNHNDNFLKLAMTLEDIALKDPYFI